jgi:hypothetical protein
MIEWIAWMAPVAVIWAGFRAVAIVYRLRHGKWPWHHEW